MVVPFVDERHADGRPGQFVPREEPTETAANDPRGAELRSRLPPDCPILTAQSKYTRILDSLDSGPPVMRLTRRLQSCILASLGVKSLGNLSGVVFETVEGHLSILADLDEVAVGITHVAAPFPAVVV